MPKVVIWLTDSKNVFTFGLLCSIVVPKYFDFFLSQTTYFYIFYYIYVVARQLFISGCKSYNNRQTTNNKGKINCALLLLRNGFIEI